VGQNMQVRKENVDESLHQLAILSLREEMALRNDGKLPHKLLLRLIQFGGLAAEEAHMQFVFSGCKRLERAKT